VLAISWLDLLILVLASYRLTHLIVFDEIAAFIRNPFVRVSFVSDEAGQIQRQIEILGTGWRYGMGVLLSCYWCVGIWSAAFFVLLHLYVPVLFPLSLIFAIAGAAAILETKV
jgi:hypothetical protein